MKNKIPSTGRATGGYLRNIEKVWQLKDAAYQETKNLSSANYWKHLHAEVTASLETLSK